VVVFGAGGARTNALANPTLDSKLKSYEKLYEQQQHHKEYPYPQTVRGERAESGRSSMDATGKSGRSTLAMLKSVPLSLLDLRKRMSAKKEEKKAAA
jgi:hypothetical protein